MYTVFTHVNANVGTFSNIFDVIKDEGPVLLDDFATPTSNGEWISEGYASQGLAAAQNAYTNTNGSWTVDPGLLSGVPTNTSTIKGESVQYKWTEPNTGCSKSAPSAVIRIYPLCG